MKNIFPIRFLILLSIIGTNARMWGSFTQTLKGPPPPARARDARLSSVTTMTVEQPLDHFGESSNETMWKMRYMTNDQFFTADGPILIMLGGEWIISSSFLTGGQMFSIGKSLGAYLVNTEHRYYGESFPIKNMSTANMKFLNVDQALADIVKLIRDLKATSKFADSPVVVFGGSYAGNMATWARLEYPDLIDGAVASSGPVLAKADFYEYYETVSDSLRSAGGQKCVNVIAKAVTNIEEQLKTPEGSQNVSKLFKTCNPINTNNFLDVQYFYSTITEHFGGSVQYSTIASIKKVCDPLVNDDLGSPEERLAKAIRKTDCITTEYDEVVETCRDTSIDSEVATMRSWFYQTCNEFGYYQTTTSRKQPFGNNVPLSFYVDHLCPDLFGKKFGAASVASGVKYINSKYGALEPNTTKVVSIHGSLDPWHRLGITGDLSEDLPAQLVIGSSHCKDLQAPASSDPAGLKEARSKVAALVAKWVREARK